ncbi:hypothetical protein PhiBTCVTUL1a_70 [Burkholderia phage phiBtTUL1a]|nr:hypothetical protein PhiBTCVTUL1a_70 [Burkholderia phage phiBtTUL1a]
MNFAANAQPSISGCKRWHRSRWAVRRCRSSNRPNSTNSVRNSAN